MGEDRNSVGGSSENFNGSKSRRGELKSQGSREYTVK